MKNLTESMKIEALKNAGFDVDKYELTELVVLTPKEMDDAKNIVEDKQLNNKKLFRRWVTAQTFRMLNGKSYNSGTHKWESGWDTYLRNNYSYQYQFNMMLEELRVLAKLEVKDKDAFRERVHFFNTGVVVSTCKDYIYKVGRYIDKYTGNIEKTTTNGDLTTLTTTKSIALPGFAPMKYSDARKQFISDQNLVLSEMLKAQSYSELYVLLKLFMRKMIKLPRKTSKCPVWKDAFKGIGAYETLKNMILFHDVVLRGCDGKKDSMEKLTDCLASYKGEGWRFHAMLKDTIELNHFDLKRSIEAHK